MTKTKTKYSPEPPIIALTPPFVFAVLEEPLGPVGMATRVVSRPVRVAVVDGLLLDSRELVLLAATNNDLRQHEPTCVFARTKKKHTSSAWWRWRDSPASRVPVASDNSGITDRR